MTLRFLFAAVLLAPAVSAQDAPADWHLRDAGTDNVVGISLDAAYDALPDHQPAEVVVAIIDSGVDIEHPDLAPVLWVNDGEIAGNGIDDDENGYVDDVHGWSFLGGADGRNLEHDTYELARLVRLCRAGTPDATYSDCAALEAALTEERQPLSQQAVQLAPVLTAAQAADERLRQQFGDEYDLSEIPPMVDVGPLRFLSEQDVTLQDLEAYLASVDSRLAFGLNPDYDERDIVGDSYDDVTERFYGNADVAGPDPNHGTGVAGLVAAVRGNDFGIDGVAPARIMAIRAVPGGDERDKDVANAIRYAVDNGADIINMSFGKGYSPQKEAVDAAVAYAAEQGVLLVHAAGNSSEDLDVTDNFPTRLLLDGTVAGNWLEVGASGPDQNALAAGFSNYGQANVDLFAPGAGVESLKPGGGIQTANGTSFAAPVVAGVAALLMAYFPDFSAAEVR
ncbi:MAG: S8 family serine peptidase, partial [Bacteroidota bacterium]